MPQNDYWEERFLLLMEMLLKQGDDYIQHSANNYIATMAEIEKDINNFYMRFADENGITYQQAKQLLTSEQRQAFQMEIDDYIAYGQQNGLDDMWIKKLENASTLHRITRLQAIQYQLRQQVEKLEAQKIKGLTETFQNIYTESCYRTAYEIQKGTGVGSAFSKIDENKINKVLSRAWAPDGKNFSDRVWGADRTQLIYQLETRFTQGIIRGEASQKIIRDMSKALDSSRKATERLVRTESAFFASASRKDTYENLGVKQYKVLATLDIVTSELCREMDGKIFDVKDYKVGTTANPFHPNCRSTTVPNIDDKYTQNQQRAARNKEGKTYYVPSDMTYKEWHKTFVENDPEWLLQEKKHQNKSADKKQYEQYKAMLGRKEVGSFDNFQEIKYNSDKWDNLKEKKKQTQITPKSIEEKGNRGYNKVRTQQELQEAAENMKILAEQYSSVPSKWSGNIIVNNELLKDKSLARKEWNCDIVLVDYADDGVILHELLHSCSSSHYNEIIFVKNQIIEEASVEFLKQQICKENHIKSAKGYTILTSFLEHINKNFHYGTDLEFAKELFNIPFPERYDWLENKVSESLRKENVLLQDYEEMMKGIRQLKGGALK